jgi:addiction module HigA family antidote
MAPKATHPGKILKSDYLDARGLSQYRLAVDIGVPPRRINEIVLGKRGITADTALRMGRYFGVDPLVFTDLQARWDLAEAARKLSDRLDAEVTPLDARKPRPKRKKRAAPSKPRPRAQPRPEPPAEPEEAPATSSGIEDYLL